MASKKAEALWDRTNEAARQIISGEIDQRDANTKRLQALRLARAAEIAATPPEQPATKRTRKKKA